VDDTGTAVLDTPVPESTKKSEVSSRYRHLGSRRLLRSETRIPLAEGFVPVLIENDLIYRGLDETRTDSFAVSVPLAIIDEIPLVVGDVGLHFIGTLEHLASGGNIRAGERLAVLIRFPRER